MIPARHRPDPFPEVRPIWEYQADEALRGLYEDYKRAFQVPWVGVAALALARYPNFFARWWPAMAAVVETRGYVENALTLRSRVEDMVAGLNPPPIANRLRELGYSDRELDEIRAMIEIFSHGNFIQVPAFFTATYLLEGHEFTGGSDAGASFGGAHGIKAESQFIMMEPHHVAGETRAVYDDIMTRLKLPFVNSDYRALSRWPSYFGAAWDDLKGHVDTPPYDAMTAEMHTAIFDTAASMADPTGFSAKAAIDAANQDIGAEQLLAVSRVFAYLIPGLVVNVAFFRQQLLE